MTPPRHDQHNRPITHTPLAGRGGRVIAPHKEHITIINNNTYVTNIRNVHTHWNRNDHGYGWYDWGGNRVCHHYDTFGYHWWGWYVGSSYFWTRYHEDRYWWYDPYYSRWVYMHDGRWWWQDPARVHVVYIYSHEDNRYYEYNESHGGVALKPDTTPPVVAPPQDPTPTPAPAPAETPVTVYSKDGSRMVQVFGAAKNAYVYDTAETPAFEPAWLGAGIEEVRFKFSKTQAADGSESETLKEILALKSDGSYDRFTPDGFLIPEENEQPAPTPVPAPPAQAPINEPGAPSALGQKSAAFQQLSNLSQSW